MTEFRMVKTDWGFFGFVARDGKLSATYLPRPARQTKEVIRRNFPDAVENHRLLPRLAAAVSSYYAGEPVRFDVELEDFRMTPFRRKVTEKCRSLAPGETISYGDLARAAGKPGAARAVGQVMATNRLPLVVPCHRVLRSDSSLGGFSSPGGLDDKRRMLELEGALIGRGSVKDGGRAGRSAVRRKTRAA